MVPSPAAANITEVDDLVEFMIRSGYLQPLRVIMRCLPGSPQRFVSS